MKRNYKKSLLTALLLIGALSVGAGGLTTTKAATPVSTLQPMLHMKQASITELTNDSRVFTKNPTIDVKKVTFANHYGYTVAGHLYLPANFSPTKTYKALVISGPFGAVKEQSSGLYAQEMAKAGFVTLAFDPSMTGESSGERRNMASPDIFTEDYHAAVDFMSNLGFVDPNRIGAIGICGLSGMALTAAVNDVRIKAIATSAMYDMSDSIRNHYKGNYYTPEQRELVKQHLAAMRNEEAKQGVAIRGAHEVGVSADNKTQTFDTMFPDTLPTDADAVTTEFYNYYVKRAYHPRAINSNTSAWDATAAQGFFDFSLMNHLSEISPRPVLLITGDKAHSKYFSDEVYEKLASPKQEIVVPGATHTDLYDNMQKIPFQELINFFNTNL